MSNISYCDGCKWCYEDSLSCEEYGYYNSYHNESSDNLFYREDLLTLFYPNSKCKYKEK